MKPELELPKHRCRDHVRDPERYRCEGGEHLGNWRNHNLCPCQKCKAAMWVTREECLICNPKDVSSGGDEQS